MSEFRYEVLCDQASLEPSPLALERLIGSIRRDYLDHVIVLNKKHLKRILSEYLSYYHNDRTHLGLSKDTPNHRSIQARVEKNGKLIAFSRVGVLHHQYEWQEVA